MWETLNCWPPDAVAAGVMVWSSRSGLDSPDFFACQGAIPIASPENIARFGIAESCWTTFGALTHPKSRGAIELTGPDPDKPVRIMENGLSHPEMHHGHARSRQFGWTSPVRQARSHAGRSQGRRSSPVLARCRTELLAPRRHGQDGTRSAGCRRRQPQGLWGSAELASMQRSCKSATGAR
jgi:hypothetical protein